MPVAGFCVAGPGKRYADIFRPKSDTGIFFSEYIVHMLLITVIEVC